MTLALLWRELDKGRIYECALRHRRWHLDGLRETDCIYVAPRGAIVETLLHELLHRARRTWSERRVDRMAHQLACGMNERVKRQWWQACQRLKRPHRAVDVE